MISAKGIQKSYGSLQVLQNVNLEVADSEVISIVGDSGAGKTTLLQILGTLENPDAGSISIKGKPIHNLSKKNLAIFRNQNIGFIFQFHQLLPEFTAIENVCIPAFIGGTGKKEAEARALKLLDRLGVAKRAQHKPSQLSGGEQQRVAVARSLMNNPGVVFADEPSGNLDSKNAEQLHRLFFELREEFGQTFVIVTHNKDLAAMADRTLTMVDGKIV